MHPVKLFCWHFMAYPYLPEDFDEKYDTGWVTVPNSLWNREKAKGLYQEYIDQLVYADELGFDGMVLNEHHQNIYGLMPSPNMIAAALSQRTKNGKIVVLGNILPMHLNPLRIAEEYAMLDCMSGGRLIAGFAVGGGPEAFNYDVPSPRARRQFWEAIDLIVKTWTDDGPFVHEGPEYPLRYVNAWPRPEQTPHPPVWVPGARSRETMENAAQRGYAYFLSSRSHGDQTRQAAEAYAATMAKYDSSYTPFDFRLFVGIRFRNRRTGENRKPGKHLVFLAELPERTSADQRPHPDLGAGCTVNKPRKLARLSGKLAIRRRSAGGHQGLGRLRPPRLDYSWQPGDGPREADRAGRTGTNRQPADPVPFRKHERRAGA